MYTSTRKASTARGTPPQAFDPALLGEDIARQLRLSPEQLADDANLLKLGMDSMHLMAWLNRFRRLGFKVTLSDLYDQPTLQGWQQLLSSAPVQVNSAEVASNDEPLALMSDGQPFALTSVQHAYLVGRSSEQPLGGVGCHLYQEFDGRGLTPQVLEAAIYQLIERHPMLKTRFLADGRQQWQAHSTWPGLKVHDLRDSDDTLRQQRLGDLREQLGHRRLDVENGETFDFQLCLLPDGGNRLLVNIDLLVADAASFNQLFEELIALIEDRPLPPSPVDYDFCSYLTQVRRNDQARVEKAKAWWLARLDDLPLAPILPLAQDPERIAQVRISRRRGQLDAAQWQAFKDHAGTAGVTPTMALATLFSAVLGRWSGQQSLLLNLTLFDRQPLNPAVASMIADFTNILALPVSCCGQAFAELAQANQQSFAEVHEHSAWSGVEVLRELKKRQRHPHGAPLVFTSNLGRPLFGEAAENTLGAPGWGISQTPQVWIDHLAFEHQGQVYLQWDSNNQLFPEGLTDTLFDVYFEHVLALVADPAHWSHPLPDLMPSAQRAVREQVNATARAIPDGLLHDAVFLQAERTPQATALIQDQRRLSFAQLADQASRLAGCLQALGVTAGDTVAVSMTKDIGQIVSVLGILKAGAIYVPVPPDQPLARRIGIYQGAQVKCVLTSADEPEEHDIGTVLTWQQAILSEPLQHQVPVSAQQPAYIIYTSGSTGEPKGVVISHQSALNTCVDISQRHAVSPEDRVLALSALHFDLSVYDIFGVLGAGASLVLVNDRQRRDPALWCRLIDEHGITLWNSVPALLDMLLTYSEGFDLHSPASLRLVMLSGDWIGLDLPGRYHQYRSDGRFVAMGGATEAAIWSNTCTVSRVEPHWRSIPYGTPLTNQRYRVVDETGRDCPDWVAGELWIGGAGVAHGYFNDAERSARQFVEVAGERWYRTGDMGCYWPDGTLEFLGRRDKQVKVGGYRIELGEIDAALNRLEGVKAAISMAPGEREKSLVAFVVPHGSSLCSRVEADPCTPASYADWLTPVTVATDTTDGLLADFLLEHLAFNGIPFSPSLTTDQVLQTYGSEARWHPLLTRWLEWLATQDRLCCDVEGAWHLNHSSTKATSHDVACDALTHALQAHHDALRDILSGKRSPQTLLEHPYWAPEQLLMHAPGSRETLSALATSLADLSKRLQRPVRLIEAGARSAVTGAFLLGRLDAEQLHYTALDTSQAMVLKARERLAGFIHGSARRDTDSERQALVHSADVLLINNQLHRLDMPQAALQQWTPLCAPGAAVYVLELAQASALALVSAELLNEGRSAAEQLRNSEHWTALLMQAGLGAPETDRSGALQRLILRAPDVLQRPDSARLAKALANELPGYMIPQRLYFLDALPLTANGKIDHQALMQRCKPAATQADQCQPPENVREQVLAQLWQELLQSGAVHRHSQFFQLGGDSLLATRLIGELAGRGYHARLDDLFNFPSLHAFAATLVEHNAPATVRLEHDPAGRYQPFALSEVQQAYLVGRQPGFVLSGVGAHFFVEFSVERLNVQLFQNAWQRLIERHDILRAVVRDGMLQVLKQVQAFIPRRHRVATLEGSEAHALRERLSHQVLDAGQWPLFDAQIVEDGSPHSRIFVSLDNLLLDGMSMQILLAELETLYLHPEQTLEPIAIGFRDYQCLRASQPPSPGARAYWQRRIDNLPPAPRLPLRCAPADVGIPRFVRLAERLPADRWERLKAQANQRQLTPSGLLLSAFSAVLSAWSSAPELTLNLTLFDRQPLHTHIDRVMGDFTSLLLLAWHPTADWLGSAQNLQQRLWRDLAQRDHSAIRVMRELASRHGLAAAQMPVVFTSALGFDKGRFMAQSSWLKPVWGISQTPQVWLDHQVYESEGDLCLNWDAVEALFDPDVLRAMFDQYVSLLERLAEDPQAWGLSLAQLVPHGHPGADVAPLPRPQPLPLPLPHEPEQQADEQLVDQIRHAFHEVVGLKLQDCRQNFFDAGASSLKLVQLHVKLTQQGHRQLQATDLFGYPNARALARHLSQTQPANDTRDQPRQAQLTQRNARRLRRNGGGS
ncbi:non-ribosomal peptide synthetase [Pseudomonas syringae group genomosp. 3]|uniref:Yersiniabactin non-ribosomal peptide synthetase n=1 Tax=Pseudomonas syringae pv. tomato (strain ATCC BAA-871 / DC3000) TaxID=223283 RepID=Q882M4_PSESM|nr:non-ribosomal peptide synthetase [Pseudomonas syringae group genomosp. 3]AAO56106.1 yersiniabactin non-ribosomal peptide synthetase [Pseudomonas syringae pv. tomato str. DC3000]KKI27970.1 peptide synthetase [Pseudomonas syringae pv. persicae]KPB89176.1 Yersiniabactin non-ribosomal peptide synthetase [Pseudomonas syringae pv. maculicola]MBF9245154.1 non-ribosomal peptide synthetase [Pseudomonas syringae pv. tomato]